MLDTCEHVWAPPPARVLRFAPAPVSGCSPRAVGRSGSPASRLAGPTPRRAAAGRLGPHGITHRAAVTLLFDRAPAVSPDLEVADAIAADVATVCMTLDGLPLAIELAAARADVPPRRPSAPGSRTASGCSSRRAEVAARQQTFRAAIDWSFDLLTTPHRTFFARLGAFAGTSASMPHWSVAGHDLRPTTRAVGVARQAVDGGPVPVTIAPGCSTPCTPTRWNTSRGPRRRRHSRTTTPTSTCAWPSRARSRSLAPTSSSGSTSSAATSTTFAAPRSSGASSPATPGRRRPPGRCSGLVLDTQRHADRGHPAPRTARRCR